MVQAERDKQTLQENEYPHAGRSSVHNKVLEKLHSALNVRPDKGGCQRSRKHHEEANHKDEGGAVKGAEPFGQLCVKVFVM